MFSSKTLILDDMGVSKLSAKFFIYLLFKVNYSFNLEFNLNSKECIVVPKV